MAKIDRARRKLKEWRGSLAKFVWDNFHVEFDPWQARAAEYWDRGDQRIVLQACKGPGKTGFLAWAIWQFLCTRRHPKVAATAISGDNLRDNLWSELAKWHAASPFLQAAFEWTLTRIVARDHRETWWASARTWARSANREQQANTLAGLHADHVLFVLDESGGIPDAVMAAAEGGLSTGKETRILQAGNPTHLEGPLYRAATSERHLWSVIEITGDPDDPDRSPRISAQWAREQIEKYGRDHSWVLVNVFGRFPPASMNALIGPDECSAAMRRHLREDQYSFAARILGVDVARFGDDQTVIFPRQGLASFKPVEMRRARTHDIAARVAKAWDAWEADACFIDDTGGWAAGVIDALILGGYSPIPVNFGGSADDPRYYNKRAEMYFKATDAIKAGAALPNLPELTRELTAHTYEFSRSGKLQILEKDLVKEALQGQSPDHADAYVLTYAQPVRPRAPNMGAKATNRVETDWDPFI